jgi:hypothetical protein
MKWRVEENWDFKDHREGHMALIIAKEFELLKDFLFRGQTTRQLAEKYGISSKTAADILDYYWELWTFRRYGGRGKPKRPEALGPAKPFRWV